MNVEKIDKKIITAQKKTKIMTVLRLVHLLLSGFVGLVQTSNGEVINHFLHLLQVILDTIKFLPQGVILQI